MTGTDVQEEERFHDEISGDLDLARVGPEIFFTAPSCPENKFILRHLGELCGKRVLDLGSGSGEGGMFFASCGADVVSVDISGEMLKLSLAAATRRGAAMHGLRMDAAALAFGDDSFDVVYGANVLHHVDTVTCLREVKRILKPGGKAAFWDPLAYNPAINVYRRIAHQVRSKNERPLKRDTLALMRSEFSSVRVNFFWLLTLVVFLKYYFIDRIHPNNERYWKKVIYDYAEISSIYPTLAAVDRLLLKIPWLRWWAWNMAVILQK